MTLKLYTHPKLQFAFGRIATHTIHLSYQLFRHKFYPSVFGAACPIRIAGDRPFFAVTGGAKQLGFVGIDSLNISDYRSRPGFA